MKRVEPLCSINSGQYDVGKTYVVSDEEAASLEKSGLVKIVREVIDLRPTSSTVQAELDSVAEGNKKRRRK